VTIIVIMIIIINSSFVSRSWGPKWSGTTNFCKVLNCESGILSTAFFSHEKGNHHASPLSQVQKSQLAFTGGEQVTFIRTAKPTTAPINNSSAITGLAQQEPSGNVTLSNLSGSPGGDSNVSTNGEPSTNSG
jgi:hypothetical protein